MNKYSLLLTIFALSYGQIFNTGKILRKGDMSIGSNGAIYTSPSDFQLNLFGGYGLSNGMDLSARLGFFSDDTYFGMDIEKSLMNSSKSDFSVSAGFHTQGDFGLDASAVYSLELNKRSNIFTGIDTDIELDGFSVFNPWLVVGVDFVLKKNTRFMFEGDLPLKNGLPSRLVFGFHYFL
jgi:hypothetical protein